MAAARWLSVLSCGSVCRSCVTVIARLASTHTALVSQSLVGLCFAFDSGAATLDSLHQFAVCGLQRFGGRTAPAEGGRGGVCLS